MILKKAVPTLLLHPMYVQKQLLKCTQGQLIHDYGQPQCMKAFWSNGCMLLNHRPVNISSICDWMKLLKCQTWGWGAEQLSCLATPDWWRTHSTGVYTTPQLQQKATNFLNLNPFESFLQKQTRKVFLCFFVLLLLFLFLQRTAFLRQPCTQVTASRASSSWAERRLQYCRTERRILKACTQILPNLFLWRMYKTS